MGQLDIPHLIKQPSESRVYSLDFTANMSNDETISSIDSFTIAPAGPTLGTPSAAGKIVQNRISGGTDGTNYKITVVITTSDSNILEGEAKLFVKDI